MWRWAARDLDLAESGGEEMDMLMQEGVCRRHHQESASKLKGAVMAAAFALLAVGVWLCGSRQADPGQKDVSSASVELNVVVKDGPCHTAVVGEQCFDDAHWAMSEGIVGHPEWYLDKCPDLKQVSAFEEFQTCIHKINRKSCPSLPCKAASTTIGPSVQQIMQQTTSTVVQGNSCHTPAPGSACHRHVEWVLNDGIRSHPYWFTGLMKGDGTMVTFQAVQAYLHKKKVCPRPCHESNEVLLVENEGLRDCRTATATDACYMNVVYGMRRGLLEHPEWFPGLDEFSSFEEFQSVLHRNPELECPKPCKCRTAKQGDKCYENVKWVLRQGLKEHPEWYVGINEGSRWEAVQEHLHKHQHGECGKPCSPKVWGSPSLFCFSVFRSAGYEVELVRSQVHKGVGIFSCDEFAVLSDQELAITDVVKTLVIPPCEQVGVSKDGTVANTQVFLQAWKAISEDLRYRAHDWVVKADPDAVVIMHRLRSYLAPYTGRKAFIQNCMKYEGAGWPTMFGSLEAYSQRAVEAYLAGAESCTKELQWSSWGEDLFMNSCLKHLEVEAIYDGKLIGDDVCKGADCADGVSASYHPFKSPEAWFQCYAQATGVTYFKQ